MAIMGIEPVIVVVLHHLTMITTVGNSTETGANLVVIVDSSTAVYIVMDSVTAFLIVLGSRDRRTVRRGDRKDMRRTDIRIVEKTISMTKRTNE